MKIREHQLNIDLSKKVYDTCQSDIEPNECYANIFKVIEYYLPRLRAGIWKVTYGYLRSTDNLYVRHCFLVDENNMAIDPTLFANEESRLRNRKYVSFMIFDFDHYLYALERENGFVALLSYLWEVEEELAIPWAEEAGAVLIDWGYRDGEEVPTKQ